MKKSKYKLFFAFSSFFCLLLHAQPPGLKAPDSTEEQKSKHAERIQKADTNGDGELSQDEFSQLPKLQELEADKVERIFSHLDKDQNGSLSVAELPIHPPRGSGQGSHHRHRLRKLDTNQDGQITKEEFAQAPHPDVDSDRRERLFAHLDSNGDGVISPEDRKERGHRPGPPTRRSDDQQDRPRPNGPHSGERRADHYAELDLDGDGKLSLEEFKQSERAQQAPDERVEKHFQHLDQNQDGFISPEERPQHPPQGKRPNGPRGGNKGDNPFGGKRPFGRGSF